MPYLKEELLHHIWQHRLFNQKGLKTTDGLDLTILMPGVLNVNAGPDFRGARIVVNGIEWAGNVEIHVRSSDWKKHDHQNDKAYENIILHVVFEDDLDEPVGLFPTLKLQGQISDQIIARYESLFGIKRDLPCGQQFMEVPELIRNGWIDSLLVARLQKKAEWLDKLFEVVHGDVEQVFQIAIFRAFGMKVNAIAFELLGLITPWKTIGKYKDNLFQLEAILFGNAGFLSSPEEEYQIKLSKEFDFIENKHGIGGLNTILWKFSRMHPKNFPTIRIAQLAALIHKRGQLLSWFGEKEPKELIEDLLVEPSEYWRSHYRFGKQFPTKGNRVGEEMARNILINAYVPFCIVMSQRNARMDLQDRAIQILEGLKPEKNSRTRVFEDVGFKPKNAAESQALIELKTSYCDRKNCLNCGIGANILKREE
jgi:hypothetical protein